MIGLGISIFCQVQEQTVGIYLSVKRADYLLALFAQRSIVVLLTHFTQNMSVSDCFNDYKAPEQDRRGKEELGEGGGDKLLK